jgi:hypothetical protein
LFLVITQNLGDSRLAPAEKAMGTIIPPEFAEGAFKVETKELTIDQHKVSVSTSRFNNTVIASISVVAESDGVLQVEANAKDVENFRFSAVEYTAPNIIYANFNNEFFSAALAGPGTLVLAFEDPSGTAENLEIVLKTDASIVKEVVAIQGKADKNS